MRRNRHVLKQAAAQQNPPHESKHAKKGDRLDIIYRKLFENARFRTKKPPACNAHGRFSTSRRKGAADVLADCTAHGAR